MTVASILQRVVSVTYFVIVARHISERELGWYSVALATTTMFVVLVDLGLTNVLIRESSREQERTQQLFSSVITVKMGLGVISYLLLVLFTFFMGYGSELKLLIFISGITMLLDSYHLAVYGVLRSMGVLIYESIGIVVTQGLTLLLGSYFLFFGYPLYFLILAFTIASSINALYATTMMRRHGIRLRFSAETAVVKPLFLIALPFAVAAVLNRIYTNADLLIVHKLAGEEAAAWYTAPYKIIAAFQFVPLALISAIYPRFSEYFVRQKDKLSYVFEQSVMYLLLLSVPVAIGIFVLAEEIVVFLFGEKLIPSVLPLKIIIFSIIFTFLSYPLGALLNACNKQTKQMVFVGIVTVSNIFLNILLVRQYGAVGAAAVAVGSSILLVLLGSMVARTIVTSFTWYMAKKTAFIIFSAVIMGVIVYAIHNTVSLAVSILIGAVTYGILLLVLRVMSLAQIQEIVNLFRKNEIVK